MELLEHPPARFDRSVMKRAREQRMLLRSQGNAPGLSCTEGCTGIEMRAEGQHSRKHTAFAASHAAAIQAIRLC
jgi:hypothetical protein